LSEFDEFFLALFVKLVFIRVKIKKTPVTSKVFYPYTTHAPT